MKTPSICFLLMLGAVVAWAEPAGDILPPQKRATTVGYAKTLLASQSSHVAEVDAASLKNPFNPALPPPTAVVSPARGGGSAPVVQSDSMLLGQIAPKITPSGSVVLGGESLLLFGQKRLKVGDHLPIIFEGKPYDLELVDIQSTSFTLRLNGAEITRPIQTVTKPVTKP